MQTKKLLFTIIMGCATLFTFSQEKESSGYPSFSFDGILKNKFEYVPGTETFRFDVRNSRLGIKGKIFPMVSYRAQVELSNEGKFQVLDLSGTLHPYKGLSFTFGQTSVPIFNSYTTNPGTMMFANRTFLAKYYAGTRDIGLLSNYQFNVGEVPVGIDFGIFNGNTTNSPEWTKNISYSARLSVGGMKGLRSTVKVYDYPRNEETHYFMYGADIRYEADNWKIETEAMQRDDRVYHKDLFSTYIQGSYCFRLNEKNLFKSIMPAARYDLIDQFKNDDQIDVSRFTLGVGFGLGKKAFNSMLRFDYEWYFVNNPLDFLQKYEEMDKDKFTVELVYVF